MRARVHGNVSHISTKCMKPAEAKYVRDGPVLRNKTGKGVRVVRNPTNRRKESDVDLKINKNYVVLTTSVFEGYIS